MRFTRGDIGRFLRRGLADRACVDLGCDKVFFALEVSLVAPGFDFAGLDAVDDFVVDDLAAAEACTGLSAAGVAGACAEDDCTDDDDEDDCPGDDAAGDCCDEGSGKVRAVEVAPLSSSQNTASASAHHHLRPNRTTLLFSRVYCSRRLFSHQARRSEPVPSK